MSFGTEREVIKRSMKNAKLTLLTRQRSRKNIEWLRYINFIPMCSAFSALLLWPILFGQNPAHGF
jgi:hypothetical protein